MRKKYLSLNDQLYHYVGAHRSLAKDSVLTALREETDRLGDEARMQIGEEQGSFMRQLVAVIGAKSAIEVGTFTGYSSICIARGLPAGGKLICCDASKQWTDIARKYWEKADVSDRIELRLGPAIATLEKLAPDLQFDFAFIDADKSEYDAYYELLLPRIRPNGVLLFDNMLWGGSVADASDNDPEVRAIDRLNKKLASDQRVETVLLPIADGLQFCRKL